MLVFLLSLSLLAEPTPLRIERKTVAAKETSSEALLREAKLLRYAQRYYEAAALYRKFLVTCPDSGKVPDARFWLAATLEQDQRWDEAADAYTSFLNLHPDQQLLGKESKLNRIRCWGIRQNQNPTATPGLLGALQDGDADVKVTAALQLAKKGDKRIISVLQEGLSLPNHAEACTMALKALGVKVAQIDRKNEARFLVITIKEAAKNDPVTIRIALALARTLENYLSNEQILQAQKKGIHLEGISDKAAKLPKGSLLLSVEDKNSTVTVTVE